MEVDHYAGPRFGAHPAEQQEPEQQAQHAFQPQRQRPAGGLSLVETIVAVGLMSMVILLTLGMIPSFKVSNRRANMELQAGGLAQSILELQRVRPFEEVISAAPVSRRQDEIDYSVELQVSPGASSRLKHVRAVIRWRWRGQDFVLFRETWICNIPR